MLNPESRDQTLAGSAVDLVSTSRKQCERISSAYTAGHQPLAEMPEARVAVSSTLPQDKPRNGRLQLDKAHEIILSLVHGKCAERYTKGNPPQPADSFPER